MRSSFHDYWVHYHIKFLLELYLEKLVCMFIGDVIQLTIAFVFILDLPTAPVSLQYANTFPGGATITSGPPAVVKTLASSLPVHALQTQQQQQPTQASITPKPQNLASAAALRPVSP